MSEKDHRVDDYFVKYKEMVLRDLSGYVDRYTAEDLCQETFIRLGEHLEDVEPEKVKAWLQMVAEHLALDSLKKGGKYRTVLDLDLDAEAKEYPDLRSDTERIAEEREDSRRRGKVLARLKLEKRDWYDALMLRYLVKMSDEEISKVKGIKKSLVGKWRQRAQEKLREWYEQEERDR